MTVPTELQAGEMSKFRHALLAWYDTNRRELPWRQSRDPYSIWVSEIMLQQTRVAAVLAHYRNFLKQFPSVRALARARESSVLAAWSGLGYYRRAGNLHAAAKILVREHEGRFPQTAEQWRALPGIGRYTAAAIASIAFNQSVAVLDGNVERVLCRLLGKSRTQPDLWRSAENFLDRNRPGHFNQAMMELGAVVCLPSQPQCANCPVAQFCRTRGRGDASSAKPRQHKREVSYGFALRSASVLLVQRSHDEGLMPGMWELPEIKGNAYGKRLFSVKHAITTTNFTVHVVMLSRSTAAWPRTPTSGVGQVSRRRQWVPISRLGSLPLTGLARKILRRAEIIQ